MKKNIVRILSALLCLSVVALTVSCSDNNTPDSTQPDGTQQSTEASGNAQQSDTPDVTQNDTTDSSEESSSDVDSTETGSEGNISGTEAVSEEKPSDTNEATTASKPSVPSTKEEIVALYVKAHNLSKSAAKTATKTKGGAYNYKNIMEVKGSEKLEDIGSKLIQKYAKVEDVNEVYSGKDVFANSPAKGSAKCNLPVNKVKKAVCNDKGSYYEVTIELAFTESNPEVNPKLGSNVTGTLFNILEKDEIESYVKILPHEGPDLRYYDCNLKARIDKQTGNLLYVYNDYPCLLYFEHAIGIKGISVGLQFIEEWSFTY